MPVECREQIAIFLRLQNPRCLQTALPATQELSILRAENLTGAATRQRPELLAAKRFVRGGQTAARFIHAANVSLVTQSRLTGHSSSGPPDRHSRARLLRCY